MVFLVVVVAPAGAAAQTGRPHPDSSDSLARDSARTRRMLDSLTARLERTEADLALLRRQVTVEASSKVRTRSRLQVELWARVLVNSFASTGPLNSADVPTFATNDQPAGTTPRSADAMGFTLRQTRVGMSVSVDSVVGGVFDGDMDLDFFAGGSAAATNAYLFPQPRLRTARFALRWPGTELMVGSETPLISGLTPVTVASVGIPGFADAGNLWNWLPQVRLTREVGGASFGATALQWGIQGALLHPFTGIQPVNEEYGVDAGERSGRPYLESRVFARWGPSEADVAAGAGRSDAGGEVGAGVHRGWLRLTGDTLSTSEALSIDARIGLSHGLELRGEGYRGRALEGLGGGGISQNFGVPVGAAPFGPPLRDTGGWMQLNWQAHPTVLTGAGCGIDAPNLDDRPERRRNEACAAHAMWRPVQPLLAGIELRHLRTTYVSRTVSGNHFNFSFGFEL